MKQLHFTAHRWVEPTMVTEKLLSRHESGDEAIFSLEYIILHSAQQP